METEKEIKGENMNKGITWGQLANLIRTTLPQNLLDLPIGNYDVDVSDLCTSRAFVNGYNAIHNDEILEWEPIK